MARGWESKSVEEQQSTSKPAPDPAVTTAAAKLAQQKVERERQDLNLQRERILSERTSSPVRRQALTAALADIESRLARLS
jgi:primosomal protein N''